MKYIDAQLADYPQWLAELGIEDPTVAESNVPMLSQWVQRCRDHADTDGHVDRIMTVHPTLPIALYLNWFYYLDFPTNDFTSHPILPIDVAELLGPNLQTHLAAMCDPAEDFTAHLVTDTFYTRTPLENPSRFLWIESPLANTFPSEAEYLASLNGRRRRDIKRKLFDLNSADTSVEFRWGHQPAEEEAWCIDQLQRRWAEDDSSDLSAALSQLFWACGVSAVNPNLLLWTVIKHRGKLSAVGFFVRKPRTDAPGDVLVYQGMARDMASPIDNIGLLTLYRTIAHVCTPTSGISAVDPTCKTGVGVRTIDIYKRGVINANRRMPAVLASANLSEMSDDEPLPPFFDGDQWKIDQELTTLYEPV